ncbi:MAG TPA: hypothetical protein VMN60_14845 [Longimicrobiales bacterium]|nr:hypothetical protein [Longimicrobiales bacterium]
MRLSAAARPTSLLAVLVLFAACAGAPARDPRVPATLTIERFLTAANQNDLDTMISLFGTRDGSVQGKWSKQEADSRMFLLASVLRHTDYSIGPEQIVPGRRDEATQFVVRLVTAQTTVQVPFQLVWSRRGQWLIENIPVDRITRPGGSR